MSDFIENRDVVKIYCGLSLAVLLSISAPPLVIYLIILGFGYWHTVVKKKTRYLLISLKVHTYINRVVLALGTAFIIVGIVGLFMGGIASIAKQDIDIDFR